MAFQASRARAYLDEGLGLLETLDSPQRGVRRDLRRALPRDARPDRGARLRRLRRLGAALAADQAADRGRGAAAVKVAVVGGGLAGLSAALELVDAGHEVTLHEARPTLGGAVQTLPRREGDPEPPPDNGQHIALGCFTEYLALPRADRRGRLGAAAAARAAGDRRARPRRGDLAVARSRCCATGTSPLGDRLRILRALARWGDAARRDLRRRAAGARPVGAGDRPLLGRVHPAGAEPAQRRGERGGRRLHGPDRAARRAGATPTCVLPTRPLGEMHGEAARPRARGGRRHGRTTGARVESLDELDADAVVVAVPPARERTAARRAGAGARGLADRQRPPLVRPRAAAPRRSPRCSGAPRTGSSTAGALTGHEPERGQYLTVVSSRRARADGAARPRARRADRRRS